MAVEIDVTQISKIPLYRSACSYMQVRENTASKTDAIVDIKLIFALKYADMLFRKMSVCHRSIK